jgi:hypothetical protein
MTVAAVNAIAAASIAAIDGVSSIAAVNGEAWPAGGGGGHRYWRAVGIDTPLGDAYELNEFHLYDGVTRVDSTCTVTVPASSGGFTTAGTGANLKDASTATQVLMSAAAGSRLSDFNYVKWDAGVGNTVAVDGIQLGHRNVAGRYPDRLAIEYSDDDATWYTQRTVTGLTPPADNTMSSTISVAAQALTSPYALAQVPAQTNQFVAPSTGTYTFRLWAAGGGSNFNTSGGDRALGGAGGFLKFDITLTAGDRVSTRIGGKGRPGTSSRIPGSGGGRTEIRVNGTLHAVCGAGAGGGGYGNNNTESWGGEGGGTTGLAGQGGVTNSGGATPGLAGTPSAGGAGGTPGPGVTGASLQGGNGSGSNVNTLGGWPNGGYASTDAERGGGGGDGYYGGGGGGGTGTWGNGGGGGSSFTSGSCSNVTHTQGVKDAAPGTGESGYVAGIAIGGRDGTVGGDGRVYITF